jgi:hypothetical protein
MFPAPDWLVFHPITLAFLHGANPYSLGNGWACVFEPFWTYILLTPLALLPYSISRVALFVVSLASFAYTAVRLSAKPWQVVMFLLSFPVMGCLMTGNIDWLVLMGLWMPPQIGLFFVLMKPQIGIGLAIFWAAQAWRAGHLRELVRVFAPVSAMYMLSFAVYGPWFMKFGNMGVNPERISGFPWVVPLGLYVLYQGIRQGDKGLATVSGPFIAPYTSQFNYSAVLVGLFGRPRAFVTAWIVLWSLLLVRMAMEWL